MAITTDPEHPIVGDMITLALTELEGIAAATRFSLTSVPASSGLPTGMLTDPSGAFIQTFDPDVPGEYSVTAYDVRSFQGMPLYPGDPVGEAREVVLSVEEGTVYVGDVMTLRVATVTGHDVTLRLQVNDETVRAAELTEPATPLAAAAVLDASVNAAVNALVGVAVMDLAPSLTSRVAALGETINAHFADTDPHTAPGDQVNPITRGEPYSDEAALATLQLIYDSLMNHMISDAGTGWHAADDTKNQPITLRPVDKASATVVISDLEERVYERHRVQIASPDVHHNADNTNVLAAPAPLTVALVAYLDFAADNAPSAPAGENEGAVDAEAIFGMSRAA